MLGLLIFVGPGYISQDYWTRCLKNADDGTCAEWNPFFTTEVYETSTSIKEWEERKLQPSNFNQDLLQKYTCEYYFTQHPEVEVKECKPEYYATFVTPADMKPGYQTHKVLHYTCVFQVFVFL